MPLPPITKDIFHGIDTDNLKEEDLTLLKKQLKEIEKRVRENNKPKTITIPSKTHNQIKKYCQVFNLNIGEWTEKTLLKEIESQQCIFIDDLTYEERQKADAEEITNRWIMENHGKSLLIKFNKPMMSTDLKYKGCSVVDGLPIYQYIGKDFTHFTTLNEFQSLGITYKGVTKNELSTFFNEDEIDVAIICRPYVPPIVLSVE